MENVRITWKGESFSADGPGRLQNNWRSNTGMRFYTNANESKLATDFHEIFSVIRWTKPPVDMNTKVAF